MDDEVALNPRNRWRAIQNLVKIFWKWGREEFLVILNTDNKWMDNKRNLKVGCSAGGRAKCITWKMASGMSRRSIPRKGWTGVNCSSEHERPQVYLPNDPTVSIEHLRWSKESDLKEKAHVQDLLFGGRMERQLNWTFCWSPRRSLHVGLCLWKLWAKKKLKRVESMEFYGVLCWFVLWYIIGSFPARKNIQTPPLLQSWKGKSNASRENKGNFGSFYDPLPQF